MFISSGKPSTFLILLTLSAFGSLAVQAQTETPERAPSVEAREKNPEVKPEPKIGAPVETISSASARLPETFQSVVQVEKKNDAIVAVGNAENGDWRAPLNAETKADEFAYRFRLSGVPPRQFDFENPSRGAENRFPLPLPESVNEDGNKKNAASKDDDAAGVKAEGFRWRAAVGQSLMFLAVQHGYAFTQLKTREALKGKFWKDYTASVKSLGGWADGGRFFTNYIAHPMQGSITGFIYVQNDPRAMKQQFGTSKDYWTSRLKAMAWTAAWSMQFEIGPISQASIGNVGLKGKQTWIDIVVTPTVGTALLISEDAVDRLVMKRIERWSDNFYVKIFSRMLLNPTRNFSNMLRFKPPWHRDRPPAR